MRDYDKLLKVGEAAQLEKLCLRKDKGDFPRDLKLLEHLLVAEMAELILALCTGDLEEARLEAGDWPTMPI